MIEWPIERIDTVVERWWLSGVAIHGSRTGGGGARLAKLDGGGLWVGEQTFFLHEPDHVRLVRAIEAQMDGGVNQIVAYSHEDLFSPMAVNSGLAPHSDGTPFSDGTLYRSPRFALIVGASAPLRGTFLKVRGDYQAIRGGEQFSILHPRMGKRRYRISKIEGDVISIRPPLREGLTGGEVMDFDLVGTVSRIANPEEFMGELQPLGRVTAVARWVESFDPIEGESGAS